MKTAFLLGLCALAVAGCLQPNPADGYKACGTDWSCFQQAGADNCTAARVDFSERQGEASMSGFALLSASGTGDLCLVQLTATDADAPQNATQAQKTAVAFIKNSPVKPTMDCYVRPAQFADFSFQRFNAAAALDAYQCQGVFADALRKAVS